MKSSLLHSEYIIRGFPLPAWKPHLVTCPPAIRSISKISRKLIYLIGFLAAAYLCSLKFFGLSWWQWSLRGSSTACLTAEPVQRAPLMCWWYMHSSSQDLLRSALISQPGLLSKPDRLLWKQARTEDKSIPFPPLPRVCHFPHFSHWFQSGDRYFGHQPLQLLLVVKALLGTSPSVLK